MTLSPEQLAQIRERDAQLWQFGASLQRGEILVAQNDRRTLLSALDERDREIAALRKDAERWRATIGSARVRVLGSAGLNDPLSNYAHIGVELWTSYNDPEYLKVGCDADRERFTKYADFARAQTKGEKG